MSLLEIIAIVLAILFGLPVMSFLISKFWTAGNLAAKRNQYRKDLCRDRKE